MNVVRLLYKDGVPVCDASFGRGLRGQRHVNSILLQLMLVLIMLAYLTQLRYTQIKSRRRERLVVCSAFKEPAGLPLQ